MNGGILVIDDAPQTHRYLRPALEAAGYTVERADTAAQGLHLAATRAPELILLDLGLPDLDGQAAIVRLRAITPAPIIVISARDQEDQKVQALDAGADDYLEKPFAINELVARLRACLRRTLVQQGQITQWTCPGVAVDLLHRVVTVDSVYVPLSTREYDLLAWLVRSAGRVITHRQLLAGVWGPAHTLDVQYLRVYIGHLRRKLGPAFARHLHTEPGVGYRLTKPVQG
jgi:two-component system KDP operon response regulator KdpE